MIKVSGSNPPEPFKIVEDIKEVIGKYSCL